jgi:hypothetical protein
MAKVRALVKCFVGHVLRKQGDVFDYDGVINPKVLMALETEEPTPIPKKPRKKKAAAKAKPAEDSSSELPDAT